MWLRLDCSIVGLLSYLAFAAAQTYTDCNPLDQTCSADPALGRSSTYDFTKGASSDFSEVGSPTYGNDGAAFTVTKQGDAPLIQSNWYIMFGHVEYVIKAAPGTGIVSSAVLQSDDLDEIDWEWLGGNNQYVQTNYFGKGDTSSFNRGATHDNPGNHDGFHTYTVDWTSTQIVWQIDGTTVRVLTPETADSNQYPQTPMMVKVGIWAGGDPNNAQGTIQWAGGVTDYSTGPYTMYLKSLKATDYSTGTSYTYGDHSGSWQSIKSNGGEINGNSASVAISTAESAPAITATVDSVPIPWSGTHRETSSFVTPSVYPWVPKATTDSAQPPSTSLPDGWTFAGSGRPQPPSRASYISLSTLPLSPSASGLSSLSGPETMPSTPSPAFSRTKSAEHSTIATQKVEPATSPPKSHLTESLRIAPSIDGANSVLNAPFFWGALCALLGSSMVLS